MALLVGQEAESAGAELGLNSEKALAFKFTAAKTGKVNALHVVIVKSGTGTLGMISLVADSANTPKIGAPLAEGEIATTIGAHEVAVAETEVVEGTVYWLVLIPTNGTTKVKEGSTGASRLGTTAVKKYSEVAAWNAEAKKGPVSIWATGTESGTKVEGKASGTLLLTGSAKGIAANVVQGKATGPLLLTGTAKGLTANVVQGKATGPLLLTGTAKGATAGGVQGKASGALLLTGTANGLAANVVAGKGSGALLLPGTAKGALSSVVQGKASGVLRLTGTAKGTVTGPVTARRVTIFIYDE